MILVVIEQSVSNPEKIHLANHASVLASNTHSDAWRWVVGGVVGEVVGGCDRTT